MSDKRILKYQVGLMENPSLTTSPCEVLNTATLLPTPKVSLPFHYSLETLDHWTKPREGLSENPLTNPEEIQYTDGSSFILMEKEELDMRQSPILRQQRLNLCHHVLQPNQLSSQPKLKFQSWENEKEQPFTLTPSMPFQCYTHMLLFGKKEAT